MPGKGEVVCIKSIKILHSHAMSDKGPIVSHKQLKIDKKFLFLPPGTKRKKYRVNDEDNEAPPPVRRYIIQQRQSDTSYKKKAEWLPIRPVHEESSDEDDQDDEPPIGTLPIADVQEDQQPNDAEVPPDVADADVGAQLEVPPVQQDDDQGDDTDDQIDPQPQVHIDAAHLQFLREADQSRQPLKNDEVRLWSEQDNQFLMVRITSAQTGYKYYYNIKYSDRRPEGGIYLPPNTPEG